MTVFSTLIWFFCSGLACSPQADSEPLAVSEMRTLLHDGIERRYGMYVPEGYDGSESLPLIVNYHGGCMDALSQMEAMNMRDVADEHRLVLVYPEGTNEEGTDDCLIWNSGPYFDSASNKTTTDDLGFTRAMIAEIVADYAIDPDRIFATGFSNGGFMTHAVGCYQSDIFAAIAPIAGMMTEEQTDPESSYPCQPSHPMPVVLFHGTADFAVPIDLGEEAVAFWSSLNNAELSGDVSEQNGVEHYVYSGGDRGARVEFYKVINGYHETFAYLDYEGANSPEIIWDFFSQYDLNGIR